MKVATNTPGHRPVLGESPAIIAASPEHHVDGITPRNAGSVTSSSPSMPSWFIA